MSSLAKKHQKSSASLASPNTGGWNSALAAETQYLQRLRGWCGGHPELFGWSPGEDLLSWKYQRCWDVSRCGTKKPMEAQRLFLQFVCLVQVLQYVSNCFSNTIYVWYHDFWKYFWRFFFLIHASFSQMNLHLSLRLSSLRWLCQVLFAEVVNHFFPRSAGRFPKRSVQGPLLWLNVCSISGFEWIWDTWGFGWGQVNVFGWFCWSILIRNGCMANQSKAGGNAQLQLCPSPWLGSEVIFSICFLHLYKG